MLCITAICRYGPPPDLIFAVRNIFSFSRTIMSSSINTPLIKALFAHGQRGCISLHLLMLLNVGWRHDSVLCWPHSAVIMKMGRDALTKQLFFGYWIHPKRKFLSHLPAFALEVVPAYIILSRLACRHMVALVLRIRPVAQHSIKTPTPGSQHFSIACLWHVFVED